MAAFAGCTDARNSRMGKVLSVILAGSLSLSFLNVANAAPAFADEGDEGVWGSFDPSVIIGGNEGNEGTETPGEAETDPTVFPTPETLHQDPVNVYQFAVNVDGQLVILEAATQVLTNGEQLRLPAAPVFGGQRATSWVIDDETAANFIDCTAEVPVAKVSEETRGTVVTIMANYETIDVVTFLDETGVVVDTKLATDKALTDADLNDVAAAYEAPAGYQLKGWNPNYGSDEPISWKAPLTVVEGNNVVFPVLQKGQWIKFDTGIGGSFIPSTLLNEDGTYCIPTMEPTREGYTFEGWVDSNKEPVVDGDVKYAEVENVLQAVWSENQNPQDQGTENQEPEGEENEDSQNPAGQEEPSPLASLTSEVATAVAETEVEGDSITKILNADMLKNDGTVDVDRLSSENDVADLIIANTDRFLGWYFKDGDNYLPFNIESDCPTVGFELTARFRPAPVVITYHEINLDHADGMRYSPNADMLIPGPAADMYASNTRFIGWKATDAAEGAQIEANELVRTSALPTELTAEYGEYVDPVAHTVTFDPNYNVQGVEAPSPLQVSYSHNGQVIMPSHVDGVPLGMELVSWNTKADGTGATLFPGDEWLVKGDTTLFAQYKRDESTIQLKNYRIDPATNTAMVVEQYNGGEFQVELTGDSVLLPGERFVWWEDFGAGNGRWADTFKTFGPNVGDDQAVLVAVVDANNNPVWSREVALHVDRAPVTVAPRDVTVGYGQELPQPTVSTDTVFIDGLIGDDVELAQNLLDVFNFSAEYDLGDNDPANLPVGTYPIKVTQQNNPEAELAEGLNNYALNYGEGTLTVIPAGTSYIAGFVSPAFTAGSRVYDGKSATVEARAAAEGSTVYYRVAKDNGPVSEWTTEAPRLLDAGMYTIEARADHPNNATAQVSRAQFRVQSAPVTITVDDAEKNVFSADPVFTGTVTGLIGNDTLNVEYYRPNTSTATGTYRIDARYTENPNYAVTVNPGVLLVKPLPTQVVPPTQDPINPQPTEPTNPSTPVPPVQATRPGLPIDPSVQLPSQQPTQQQPQQQPTQEPLQLPTGPVDQSGYTDYQQQYQQQDNGVNVIVPTPGDANAANNQQAPAGAQNDAPADAAVPAPADPIVIDDNATPMASSGAPVYSPSTTIDTGMDTPVAIEDDENPLGAFDEPICWVHWAILLGVMITAGFGIIVVRRRMATAAAVAAMEQQMYGSPASSQAVYAPIPEYRAR